jgi:hypothetical protein
MDRQTSDASKMPTRRDKGSATASLQRRVKRAATLHEPEFPASGSNRVAARLAEARALRDGVTDA